MYPSFENTTGWKMESKYRPLAADIREELSAFFHQHNEQLFALLGR